MRLHSINLLFTITCVSAFSPSSLNHVARRTISTSNNNPTSLFQTATEVNTEIESFIATELRGAAMKLHTRVQAPKEGQAVEKEQPKEKYVPTHLDYLKFLVDSQVVYQTFEEILQKEELHPELKPYVNTGLERSDRLEQDIVFIVEEYGVERPAVGDKGQKYADIILNIANKGKEGIPELMCHYYNYYFAHTAGGRMIGKQMASLLLEKKTLEFYKWDGDLNKTKETVKASIEKIAASWSREEKDLCVGATAAAFMGGGGINSYLSGGRGGHH
jgi:heme oxygenase